MAYPVIKRSREKWVRRSEWQTGHSWVGRQYSFTTAVISCLVVTIQLQLRSLVRIEDTNYVFYVDVHIKN